MAVIIDYEDKYIKDFQRLNLEWLEKFNLTESHDLEILNHPRENVIDRGGFLFLLLQDDIVIGTAGIFKINDTEYELIKMSVAIEHRGKKFGDMLLEKCISKAKEYGHQSNRTETPRLLNGFRGAGLGFGARFGGELGPGKSPAFHARSTAV